MLVGSLLGDACGGPVEFKSQDILNQWLPNVRHWSAEEFQQELSSGNLGNQLRLLPYIEIRPDVAPYGPWERNAAAGTVTDDSRHKIILLHCLRQLQKNGGSISRRDLCQSYLQFLDHPCTERHPSYAGLAEESFREYNSAARWILGNRNLAEAFPPQRLWVGISTCSGQMTLPPIAAVFPGKPDEAYRAAYALGFVDVGGAKDLNSALIAALSAAIGSRSDSPRKRWDEALQAVRTIDPYRYGDVPFAKRPATEWLDFALKASKDAGRSASKLFDILEERGRAKYFWDAHFTYACSFAFLDFCEYRPRAAMVLSLAFGHDTDSAAQVIGALAGAVHGTNVFPQGDVEQVLNRLKVDYGEDVDDWVRILAALADRDQFPKPVRFIEEE